MESFGLAALTLAVLIFAAASFFFLRRRSSRHNGSDALGGGMRIGILESVPVDARRRLVLVRRDDVEHLVMIGGPSEFVVETNIGRAGPAPLADDEPSAAGRRALKEATDRHASHAAGRLDTTPSFGPSPQPASTLPVDFTFDESELLEGLDVIPAPEPTPAQAERPRRQESAPILSGPQVPPGAANDVRDADDPIPLPGPTNRSAQGSRGPGRSDPQEWEDTPSDASSDDESEGADAGGTSQFERMRPGSHERSRFSGVRRGSDADEVAKAPEPSEPIRKRGPHPAELPAARQLPSTASLQPAKARASEEIDIENEIVRALGMDTPDEETEAAQLPAVKQVASGEPRTRLGDLADRLEEALAREVRSASQAKSRLDLDLDSFGFDRERGRAGSSPVRQGRAESARQEEQPKPVSEAPAAAADRPAAPSGELAEAAAKREARMRVDRQDTPPVISLSARRREASDPLEDEMARLLGELTGDGSRR